MLRVTLALVPFRPERVGATDDQRQQHEQQQRPPPSHRWHRHSHYGCRHGREIPDYGAGRRYGPRHKRVRRGGHAAATSEEG